MIYLVGVVIGSIVFVFGWRAWRLAEASVGWTPVDGEIVTAMDVVMRQRTETGTFHHAAERAVRYRYRFGDRDFEGDRIRFKPGRVAADADAAKYPAGRRVRVYVNPAQPGQSVLETGSDFTNYLMMFVGALFAVGGVVMAVIRG
jgi:hypothetical protein